MGKTRQHSAHLVIHLRRWTWCGTETFVYVVLIEARLQETFPRADGRRLSNRTGTTFILGSGRFHAGKMMISSIVVGRRRFRVAGIRPKQWLGICGMKLR